MSRPALLTPLDLLLLDADALARRQEESARQAALRRFLERLLEQAAPAFPPPLERLLRRLTRSLLSDLLFGFLLDFFRPDFAPEAARPLPFHQAHLQAALGRLSALPPARAELFAWSLAALRGGLFPFLTRDAPLRRRLALLGLQAFSPLLPRRSDLQPELAFGLTVLALLLRAARRPTPDQFAALCRLADDWAADFDRPQPAPRNPFDLLSVLLLARLSAEQAAEIHRRLRDWTLRFLPSTPALAEPLAGLLSRLAEGHPCLPPAEATPDSSPPGPLSDLLDLLASLPFATAPGAHPGVDDFWSRRALLRALPAFLRHPAWLPRWQSLLETKGKTAFDESALDLLAEPPLRPSPQALSPLFDLLLSGQRGRWARQLFPLFRLSPELESWLEAHLQSERRLPVLEALMDLQRAALAAGLLPERLTDALRLALQDCLTAAEPHFSPHALVWLLEQDEPALASVLRALRKTWPGLDSPAPRRLLRALGEAALQAASLRPAPYLAARLVHPADPLATGLPLPERLERALRLLRSPRLNDEQAALLQRLLRPEAGLASEQQLDQFGPYEARCAARHPRLLPILLEPLTDGGRAGAPDRLAALRALERADSPLVVPLLREAFDLAVELEQAWAESGSPGEGYYFSEFSHEAEALAQAVLRALAGQRRFSAPAVSLLEGILNAPHRLGLPRRYLSPHFLQTEIWPRLASPRHLSAEARPALLEALDRWTAGIDPSRPWPERQTHELGLQACALLLLHETDLSASQQARLHRAYQAAFESLTRAALLLVLGRQRPLSEAALRLLLDLLAASPLALRRRREQEWRLQQPSFPDQAGDILLVQGVAVVLAADLLRFPPEDLPPGAGPRLREALHRLTNPLNRALEPRLTRSTHPLVSARESTARFAALVLSADLGLPAESDPDWLALPADLAYFVLNQIEGEVT